MSEQAQPDKGKKEVTIIVNAQPKTVAKEELSSLLGSASTTPSTLTKRSVISLQPSTAAAHTLLTILPPGDD